MDPKNPKMGSSGDPMKQKYNQNLMQPKNMQRYDKALNDYMATGSKIGNSRFNRFQGPMMNALNPTYQKQVKNNQAFVNPASLTMFNNLQGPAEKPAQAKTKAKKTGASAGSMPVPPPPPGIDPWAGSMYGTANPTTPIV